MMSPTMREIVREVCQRRRLKASEVLSRSKADSLVWARFEAMYLIYQTGKFSLPQIGRAFGRDHSTVLNGIRRFSARIDREQYENGDAKQRQATVEFQADGEARQRQPRPDIAQAYLRS